MAVCCESSVVDEVVCPVTVGVLVERLLTQNVVCLVHPRCRNGQQHVGPCGPHQLGWRTGEYQQCRPVHAHQSDKETCYRQHERVAAPQPCDHDAHKRPSEAPEHGEIALVVGLRTRQADRAAARREAVGDARDNAAGGLAEFVEGMGQVADEELDGAKKSGDEPGQRPCTAHERLPPAVRAPLRGLRVRRVLLGERGGRDAHVLLQLLLLRLQLRAPPRQPLLRLREIQHDPPLVPQAPNLGRWNIQCP
mmetsp:Transcript_30730/g.88723  ORF Transcript_30730/g.88723 Transcript_30730/m.88723 type:complete len:250 (+) Transcript_30730:558-1307(+)